MEKKTYYITTPIYYPNDKLHIGHSYTTVAADVMSKYKKMRGYEVKFLTGTDEHGQKIERVASLNNVTPKEYVDKIVDATKELWEKMNIDYDIFLRTTDEGHIKAVQKIFKKLYDQGDIYKGNYEGLYCTPCEAFYTENQAKDKKCPDCGRDVEILKEEAYFFKLSKYQDRLIEHIENNPDFIMPKSRQNEMLNNFLKVGLEDLCVSRTSFKWGVPVSFDTNHVVYVWMDALSNYATALGYMSDNDTEYKKFWPADVHVVGKEVVRFHAIIWPAILMALNEPLPKQIYGHGWLIIDGGKMSKSKGNVVDPNFLVDKYGVDAIRYFLMREIAFGQDGNFTNEALIQRINFDLANDLGNLLSRTVGMIDKYFGGTLPENQISNSLDIEIENLAKDTVSKVENHLDNLLFSNALSQIWTFVRRNNKYIDETQPWILAKDEEKKQELANIMYTLSESLRIVSILIYPFMQNTTKAIWKQLNINDELVKTWESAKQYGLLKRDITIKKGEIVFPRIDMKKELKELEELKAKAKEVKEQVKEDKKDKEVKANITIDDFSKVELKVGKILECEKVEGSDKLLKSKVSIGDEVKQIVSGIAKYYTPEEMVNKKVIVVVNLKPVKLRGVLSEGMILAASNDKGELSLATVDSMIESGAVVS